MSQTQTFGRHRVRFLPPDLVHIVFEGDVSRTEARGISEFFANATECIDTHYLADQLGTIAPDGRRELAAQRKPPRTDRDYRVDLAFIGASLRTKVLMTVAVAAASIASNVKVRTQYVAGMAEALAWAQLDHRCSARYDNQTGGMVRAMAGWLLKTEPSTYSFADLRRDKKTRWDGITNPVALRNLKSAKPGDVAVVYHTGDEKAAVGLARIAGEAYPDPKNAKLWVIDLEAGEPLGKPVTLAALKAEKTFSESPLVRQGRLSFVPLTLAQLDRLLAMARS
jgi:predicted RNA-binding protein with PUA-like domain